ncbi:hypothetical protein EV122DRAFT_294931 [Schizophyllum commune]
MLHRSAEAASNNRRVSRSGFEWKYPSRYRCSCPIRGATKFNETSRLRTRCMPTGLCKFPRMSKSEPRATDPTGHTENDGHGLQPAAREAPRVDGSYVARFPLFSLLLWTLTMGTTVFEEVHELSALLASADEALREDATASVDIAVSQIVEIMHDHRPLQRLFAPHPPADQPYATFGLRGPDQSRLLSICTAISSLRTLLNLSKELNRPDMVAFEVDFFPSVFDWIDYLLPLGCEAPLLKLPRARQAWYILKFTEVCLSFLQSFTLSLPKERVFEMLGSGEERATAVFVRVWMHLPRTLKREGAMEFQLARDITNMSTLLLPLHYVTLQSGILRDRFDAEVMRQTRNHPRRLFRAYAVCIRDSLSRAVTKSEVIFFGKLLCALMFHSKVPDLGTPLRMPNSLIAALLDALYPPHFSIDSGISELVWYHLSQFVVRSDRTLIYALEHNFFPSLLHLQSKTATPLATPSELYPKMERLSNSRTAVNAFQSALLRYEASHTTEGCREENRAMMDIYKRQADLFDGAEKLWEELATCSNAKCPSGEDKVVLKACACGEALYCSKACQRAHWTKGWHNIECASRNNRYGEHGVLSAMGVLQMIWRAKLFIPEYYKGALAHPLALRIPLYVTMEWRDQSERHFQIYVRHDSELPDECISTPQPVVVDFSFEQEGRMRQRRLQFFLEGYAGRIEMPFRLLSQVFIASQAHTVLEYCTSVRRIQNAMQESSWVFKRNVAERQIKLISDAFTDDGFLEARTK